MRSFLERKICMSCLSTTGNGANYLQFVLQLYHFLELFPEESNSRFIRIQ